MRTLIQLGQSLLCGLGLLWLFLSAYYELTPSTTGRVGFWEFLVTGMTLGLVCFLVDGLWVSGFLRRDVVITSNAFDTRISVLFGDIFAQDGLKVIGVNDFFDSAVDGNHVSPSTLHGLMLTRFWAGNATDWVRQVEEDLAGSPPD